MNRYLLAGCAAVALGMGCGAANAEGKFEVKLGGDAYFEAGMTGQTNDSGLRNTEFRNRYRLNVIPTFKADNGLEYGARVRIRANSAAGTVDGDRAYIFVGGSFGQVRMGVTDSYTDDTMVVGGVEATRPMGYLPLNLIDEATNYMGSNGTGQTTSATGQFQGANVGGGTVGNVNNGSLLWATLQSDRNATKIVYYSPRFSGFGFGASYTPRNDSVNTDVNRLNQPAGTGLYIKDLLEVNANYKNDIGGVNIQAMVGYMFATTGKNASTVGNYNNFNALYVGTQLRYAGFQIGASLTDFFKSMEYTGNVTTPAGQPGAGKPVAAFQSNTYNVQAGIAYQAGPLIVGIGYMYGTDPGAQNAAVLPKARELNVYEIGAGYTVAPGLTFQAQADYFQAKSNVYSTATTGNSSDKGVVGLVRTVLAF